MQLSSQQRGFIIYTGPAVATGAIAWLIFLLAGETPVLRATGLAAAVIGLALALRHMGGLMSVAGGLTLAFSPAFWAQTGGGGSTPATIVLALAAAGILAVCLTIVVQRPYVALVAALIGFTLVFFSQIGTARSLRLTVLAAAWLIYLLVQAVTIANPRPEDDEQPDRSRLVAALRAGTLLVLVVAIINDPLFVLFAPAATLGLMQSHARIPVWYWGILAAVIGIGGHGLVTAYIHPVWWGASVEAAYAAPDNVPYLVADGLHDGRRWVETAITLTSQLGGIGLLLGMVGLSRLSRWYPPVGTVMIVGCATFFAFGLMYFGDDRLTLLLPLVMMQIFLLCYAVYAAGQWAAKVFHVPEQRTARLIAPLALMILPLALAVPVFTP